MKLNIGRILVKAVKVAKDNPEIALAVVGLAAPGLAAKAVKVAAKAKVAREVLKRASH